MPPQPKQSPGDSRKIGVQALADRLDLSIGTVSRALRNDPVIRAQTRKRVQEAAAAVGYIPNHQARLLRMGKSQRLGLLLPTLANPVYAEKVVTAQAVARSKGYDIAFACPERDVSQEDSLLRHLISLGVDGLIVMLSSAKIDSHHAIHLALARQIPVVVMGSMALDAPEGCSTLRVDTSNGRRLALAHLLSLGHRRFGFVMPPHIFRRFTGESPDKPSHEIRRLLIEAGVEQKDYECIPVSAGIAESGYQAMIQRLQDPAPWPTALLAIDDQVAIGAMTALQNHGWRVPEDISMVGSDNTVGAKFCRPCLTTLSQTHLDLGRRAIEMIVRRIDDPTCPPEHVLLQPTLVVGASTGPVRAR